MEARKAAGLTQVEVSKHLNISQGTLAELEKKGHGSAHTPALAKMYGVDAHWLATGEGDMAGGHFSPSLNRTLSALRPEALWKIESLIRLQLDMEPAAPTQQAAKPASAETSAGARRSVANNKPGGGNDIAQERRKSQVTRAPAQRRADDSERGTHEGGAP